MPLNVPLFTKVIAKQGEKTLIKEVRPLIKLDFETKKREFFKEFDADPVSQEISAGPEAFSQVPVLASAGGNLFSLLGFYAEQKPIDSLREYLYDNIVLYKTTQGRSSGRSIIFETDVYAPSMEDIDSAMSNDSGATLSDWTDRSFTDLLENGIGGLPNYLFDLTRDFSKIPSRSGPAIQAKNPIRNTNIPRIRYTSRLLGVLEAIMFPDR